MALRTEASVFYLNESYYDKAFARDIACIDTLVGLT